jgi:hypothetical protein
MTAVLLRMPSRLSRALAVAGLASVFAMAGSLTVAMADEPTADPTVQASAAPAADAEPDPAAAPTADPVLAVEPSSAPAAQPQTAPAAVPAAAAYQAKAADPSARPVPATTASTQTTGSVLDQVGTVIMAPVQTAVAGHVDVAAFFHPRPWLVALFLGLTIAVLAMLAAGFKERRQLARL